MTPNPEKLTCLALILCDKVYEDSATKTKIITAAFNQIDTDKLPCRVPCMTILATLTNGNGNYELEFTIEHEGYGMPLMTMKGPLRVPQPLAIVDMVMVLHNLELPESGTYWVGIRSDGDLIMQRPFHVRINELAKQEN